MASTTLAELAKQAMTPLDFPAFMRRNGYALDNVAAELGISRRLAAYYATDREIPRSIALACRYLDGGAHHLAATSSVDDAMRAVREWVDDVGDSDMIGGRDMPAWGVDDEPGRAFAEPRRRRDKR